MLLFPEPEREPIRFDSKSERKQFKTERDSG